MVGELSDITESKLQPRCIHVNWSKIQNIRISTLIPLLFTYEALGWLVRVPYIYPVPILYLTYHLTVPTRVGNMGVCFVYIPKVSTIFNQSALRIFP